MTDLPRTHWIITTPAGKTFEQVMSPPATLAQMQRMFPGCKFEEA